MSKMAAVALGVILKQFESSPQGPVPTVDDWYAFESDVGRSVPYDYKQIIEHTGGAPMGHLYLRNPAERANVSTSLTAAALLREHAVWQDALEKMMRTKLFPEPGGLIQLAHVDGVSFALPPEGDEIVILDRGSWVVLETGLHFSALIWTLFTDRAQYEDLGYSIWGIHKELFV